MSVGGRARRAAHVKLRLPGQRHWVWSALQREVDNFEPPAAYYSGQQRHPWGRIARGSVSLRKMTCRPAAGLLGMYPVQAHRRAQVAACG